MSDHFRLCTAMLLLLVVTLAIAGCGPQPPVTGGQVAPGQVESQPSRVQFDDQVQSNRQDDGKLDDLSFTDTRGRTVRLDQYRGDKHVLLVFTRGFFGTLCPFCTTQTSRLIANYDEFRKRQTEILLVYPGGKEQLPSFEKASIAESGRDAFPFPVLLDQELAAVKRLDIAAHLAYPSTFLIDKQGNVRLSYVGANPADRPSIQALLDQIDAIAP